jgi:fructoselysine 3-epimerase
MKRLNPNKICGSNFSYYRFTFDRFLNDMASLDLRAIEIWGVAPHLHVDEVSSADLRAIKQKISEHDLTMVCFTPEQILYPINIAAEEDWLRTNSINFFRRSVEICAELECPLLFLTSGSGYEDCPRDPAWNRSAESLAKIMEYAATHGVTGVLEALQPRESNLVLSARDIRAMIDQVGAPNLKVALDTVAMAVAGDSITDYARLFGADMVHAHFIDGAPAGHLAWGDGQLPMAEYLTELAQAGYDGYLSLEFGTGSYRLDPIAPVRQSAERIRAALSA